MRRSRSQLFRVLFFAVLASGLALGPALPAEPDDGEPDDPTETAASASAAAPGGDCCADLEERVAELEAATAKKKHGKALVRITGAVDLGLLMVGEGGRFPDHPRIADNANDGTSLTIEGETSELAGGRLTVAFKIEMRVTGPSSDTLDQTGASPAFGLELGEVNIAVTDVTYGTITLGQVGGMSDSALDADLSGTELIASPQASDVGGGFFLRRGDAVTELTFADAFGQFGGLSSGGIRYDTPSFGGLVLSAAVENGGGFDFGAEYESAVAGFEVSASAGVYADRGVANDRPASRAVLGSFSVLEPSSGVSLMLAAGTRHFSGTAELTDGSSGHLKDERFVYGKLGLLQRLVEFGDTGFYLEAGRFEGGIGLGASAEAVAGLAGISAEDVCGGGGLACFVSGSKADLIGIGVVQDFEALGMKAYLGYRHQSVTVDLTDDAGTAIPGGKLTDLDTVLAGVRIEF